MRIICQWKKTNIQVVAFNLWKKDVLRWMWEWIPVDFNSFRELNDFSEFKELFHSDLYVKRNQSEIE